MMEKLVFHREVPQKSSTKNVDIMTTTTMRRMICRQKRICAESNSQNRDPSDKCLILVSGVYDYRNFNDVEKESKNTIQDKIYALKRRHRSVPLFCLSWLFTHAVSLWILFAPSFRVIIILCTKTNPQTVAFPCLSASVEKKCVGE